MFIFFIFSGGKLVDPSPEIEKELKAEREKLEKQFGGGSGVDMTAFPTFKFEEPKLDPIDEQAAKKWRTLDLQINLMSKVLSNKQSASRM